MTDIVLENNEFLKDPNEVLDYKFDWKALTNNEGPSDWLEADETIISHTVTPESGITLDSDDTSDDDTSVIVWLSGGNDEADYNVVCQVVTSKGRTGERTILIRVRER